MKQVQIYFTMLFNDRELIVGTDFSGRVWPGFEPKVEIISDPVRAHWANIARKLFKTQCFSAPSQVTPFRGLVLQIVLSVETIKVIISTITR